MSTINPENPYNPAHAEDLTLTEVDQSVVSPLTGLEGVYPRYATFVYNVNNGNNNDIHPENPYNPAHAEDCALVEIDSSVIPPLSGKEGLYPRYAKLVYLLNDGGTSDYNDLENKPTINGVTLSGDLSTVDLSVSYNDLENKPTINGATLSGDISDEILEVAQSSSEFLMRERIGKFYAPAGAEKVSCNRANYNIQPTCSFVFTTDSMNESELFTMFGCPFGGHTSSATAFFTIMDDQRLDTVTLNNIPAAPIYCVAFVWTSDGKIKIAANDSSLAATSLSFSTSVTEFGFNSTYANGDSSFSRLAVFDFDILDENAPYTFADYRAGKSVPRALRSRYGYSTDTTMGASTSAWNITTPPEEYSSVKNGDWVAGPLVSYLKNRASDLPDGESYAIDLAMNGSGNIYEQAALSNSYGHFQTDTSTRKYRIKFKYKWNKLTSATDSVFFGVYIWGPEISEQQLVKINAPTAPDTSWHEYDAVITDSIEDGLYIPALFVSPTNSPTYGDYAISVAGFSITTADDVLCEADDALSGPQIHDLSGNGNHLNFHEGYVPVGLGVSADKNRNPASACYDNFSLDLSKNTGARIGGSTVVAAAGKCVCTLKLWSDKALTLRVSASGYTSSVTFSAARTWQSVNCWGGGDYNIPISIFRNAAGTGIVNLRAAITYDELIM